METAVMLPLALGFALVLEGRGEAAFGHHGFGHLALMAGARFRDGRSAVHHEHMPTERWAGFLLVWTALAVLTWDGLRAGRRRERGGRVRSPRESAELRRVSEHR